MKQNELGMGVVIGCSKVESVSNWFCENLFFEKLEDTASGSIIANESCILYLEKAVEAERPVSVEKATYACGLEHIALNTADIKKAASYLRSRGLELDIEGEDFSYNPKVFGDGEYYFHVKNEFGLIIEISQKANVDKADGADERTISGLDHYGIPCMDFDRETSFFRELGFSFVFEPVENYNDIEGHIKCVMMKKDSVILEIYEFTDRRGMIKKDNGNLRGLVMDKKSDVSPSGVGIVPAEGYDIVAIGECLVDILCREEDGVLRMEGNPGGAPANVLAMAARLGMATAMATKVGDDDMGSFLKKHVAAAGIGLSSFRMDREHPTTLAMVKLDESGNRSFSFYRDRTADVMLSEEDLSTYDLSHTKILHFGSLSLTDEPSRSATMKAIKTARASGAVISYDPNLRPALWKDLETARREILAAMEYADLVKVSDEELLFLTGEADMSKGMEKLFSGYPMSYLVVTKGDKGAELIYEKGHHGALAYDTGCVDTTGAGDASWGAFLSGFIMKDGPDRLHRGEMLDCEEAEELLRFSCAAGSLATSRYGGIPAMPYMEEITKCMADANYIIK